MKYMQTMMATQCLSRYLNYYFLKQKMEQLVNTMIKELYYAHTTKQTEPS